MKRRVGRTSTTLVLMATMVGCSSGFLSGADGDREVHVEGDGPLSVSGGGGGISMVAPKGRVPWTATFGSTLPCSTTGGPIQIEDIRYEFKVEPRAYRHVAFLVAEDSTPIGSARTAPERQLDDTVQGDVLGPADELKVTLDCDRQLDSRPLRILTVLRVGAEGGEVSKYYIDYTSEGKDYSLEVDWQLVACGSRTPKDLC